MRRERSVATRQGRARNIIWGKGFNVGEANKRVAEGVALRLRIFFGLFEIVHFGAKVTNAVHHHWFSGGGVTVKGLT